MSNQKVTMKLGNNSTPVLCKFWLFPKRLGEEIISFWTGSIVMRKYSIRVILFEFCYWYLSDRCDLSFQQ